MHIHSVSAQQASICNYSMRPCLGLRAAIAHLFQPQAYCQAHHIIVRNLKAVIELDQQKKTRRKLHKPLTQKVLRQEASERWLFSLSSGDSDTTAGVRAEEFATGLELCASADDLLQSEEVANGSDTANAWVLGIDPDNGGAVAVLKPGDSAAQVYDAPTVQVCSGKRTCRRLDTRSIISLLRGLEVPKGSSAYIEQAIPFPRDGKQDESRFIACNLFPYLSPQLKRKKDHGRAEALLIARYGREVM